MQTGRISADGQTEEYDLHHRQREYEQHYSANTEQIIRAPAVQLTTIDE